MSVNSVVHFETVKNRGTLFVTFKDITLPIDFPKQKNIITEQTFENVRLGAFSSSCLSNNELVQAV